MKIEFTALTDVGRVRELNEDNFRLLPENDLAVVCDGMGGHAAGEVASELAVETIGDVIADSSQLTDPPDSLKLDKGFLQSGRKMVHAIRLASRRIYLKSVRNEEMRGMGTTVVTTLFEGGSVIICHVGDSRVYRFRNGNLEQLTMDHSWVNELINSKQLTEEESKSFVSKNVITRALGTREDVKVDIRQDNTCDGDIYLLCSDGLCGFVSDGDILAVMSDNGLSLDQMAQKLVDMANQAGGEDNITVALARITDHVNCDEIDKNFSRQTVDVESDAELEHENDVIKKLFDSNRSSGEQVTARVDTRPLKVPSRRRFRFGWLLLVLILIAGGVGAWAYLNDYRDFQYTVDGWIDDVRQVISGQEEQKPAPSEIVDVPRGTAYLRIGDFPDSLLGLILYVDMVPQGSVRQYLSERLGLDPGMHTLQLKDGNDSLYASLRQVFDSGQVFLDYSDFNFVQQKNPPEFVE